MGRRTPASNGTSLERVEDTDKPRSRAAALAAPPVLATPSSFALSFATSASGTLPELPFFFVGRSCFEEDRGSRAAVAAPEATAALPPTPEAAGAYGTDTRRSSGRAFCKAPPVDRGSTRADEGCLTNVEARRLTGCTDLLRGSPPPGGAIVDRLFLALAAVEAVESPPATTVVVVVVAAAAVVMPVGGRKELRRGALSVDMLMEPRRAGWISLRVCMYLCTCVGC